MKDGPWMKAAVSLGSCLKFNVWFQNQSLNQRLAKEEGKNKWEQGPIVNASISSLGDLRPLRFEKHSNL